MATFITIGYGTREGYDRTDLSVRDSAHAHNARLRAAGVLMGSRVHPCSRQRRGHPEGAELYDKAS
jgi:hypothetical protein